MDAGKPTFEREWPELAQRLKSTLMRRNVSRWLADDIVQETGYRLFKMWDEVDPERSPWGLTLTIAKNILWDETHRRASREVLVDLPDRAEHLDVEQAGIARLELWRVGRALRKMSPSQRSVLLAEVGEAAVQSPSAAATKMLRMRARRRLHTLLEGASASCIAGLGALRRSAFNLQQLVRRGMPVVEGSTSMTVAALVGAVIVMIPSDAVTSPEQRAVPSESDGTRLATAVRSALTTAGTRPVVDRPAGPRPSTGKNARPSGTDGTTSHEVSFGDDDVGGHARVEVKRKKSKLIRAPRCESQPGRPGEIHVRCTVETRDERYTVEGRVRTGIDPDG